MAIMVDRMKSARAKQRGGVLGCAGKPATVLGVPARQRSRVAVRAASADGSSSAVQSSSAAGAVVTTAAEIATPVKSCCASVEQPIAVNESAGLQASGAVLNTGDSAWMMTSTALVLAMNIPGLSLFYGGLVGRKNVLSIFTTCMALTCFVSLAWFAFGYSLVFTDGTTPFIGNLSKAFMTGVSGLSVEAIPEALFALFQCTFAVITPGLMIGAFAERMKFSAVAIFCVVFHLFVYIPFAHMVWGGGYFDSLGLLDFAGGIVVHLTAGAAALLACIMVGKRKAGEQPPHNLPMCLVGTGLLWVGWFGFNAGSAVAANGQAALAMVATQVAAAAAGAVWMIADWVDTGKPTALGLCCGVVAGLVCVTPGAGFVSPLGAGIMGALAGVICRFFVLTVKHKFGYDDALDVWGVHGVGGLLGNELTAIFGTTAFGGTEAVASVSKLFMVHTYASLMAIAWSMAVTFITLKLIDVTIGLRPTDAEETKGLDVSDHGEIAYIDA